MLRRITLIILSLFFSNSSLSAKQKDFVGWTSISVEKKMNKNISFNFLNQYILNQDLKELSLCFFDGGISYRYNSNFSLAGNIRISSFRNLDNFYENRTMFYGDVSYAKGFGKFGLSVRSRFQRQYYTFIDSEDPYRDPRNYIRNKLSVRYRYDGYWSLFVSEEQFYRIDKRIINAWRTGIGINYQLNLHHKLEFSYLVQQVQKVSSPRTDYICSISYAYRF